MCWSPDMSTDHLPHGWECVKHPYAMSTGAWYRVRRPDRPDAELALIPQNYVSEKDWFDVWARAEAGPDPSREYVLLPRGI